VRDASSKRVPVSLAGSLRRLQIDYMDVYVWHISPKPGEAEEVAAFLAAARQKGQVRAVGISTGHLADAEFLHSLGCLDVVQFPRSMISPPDPVVTFLAEHRVGGVVRGAFAGGRLSGRYFHVPPKFSSEDIRSNQQRGAANLSAEFARYAVFEEMLTPQRGTVQLALRWLLDEPTTSVIIPGGKSPEDYRQAIRATELPPLTLAENRASQN
jgi:myo-inositol catabolism protein IolS